MLSVTESPIDLANAQVLEPFGRDVLIVAIKAALIEWEAKSTHGAETGDVHAEVVYRMQVNQAKELLDALDGRTVILADRVIDLG